MKIKMKQPIVYKLSLLFSLSVSLLCADEWEEGCVDLIQKNKHKKNKPTFQHYIDCVEHLKWKNAVCIERNGNHYIYHRKRIKKQYANTLVEMYSDSLMYMGENSGCSTSTVNGVPYVAH